MKDIAVPHSVINGLHQLRTVCALSLDQSITVIRNSLVPAGYVPHPFRPNTEESLLDKLRSILATYRFRRAIKVYQADGVDFSTYLYVPEFDEQTGEYFHEREDHCHILKRIWKHTREAGPPGTNFQGLMYNF